MENYLYDANCSFPCYKLCSYDCAGNYFKCYETIVREHFQKLVLRVERTWGKAVFADLKKLGIKLKFADFTQTTLERTMDSLAEQNFLHLLAQIWQRRNGRKIRLIGLSVHFPEKKVTKQLNLWE